MISEMVTDDMMADPDLWLLITNAIYFQGPFKISFDERQTKEDVEFYADHAHSSQAGTVTMMHSLGRHAVARKVRGAWDVVRLEYGQSQLALVLVIHKHGKG